MDEMNEKIEQAEKSGGEFDQSEFSKLPDGSTVITKPMEDIMHLSMMSYAEHVILERALPRVEDGLKPVQRRILYSMYEMGLTPDKPFRKSAAIVGDCLGKYHPHGDSSVYDAMVRMAQNFNMRETLVEGQGNFGNIDGDNAAAMRYTEARLTPVSLELLKDIEKNTVEFVRNYDDRLQEPAVLPGRFPNLLVNGASGIAVGLATNIPPHNLGEIIDGVVAYIDNRDISLKAMMKIIKGPDFPTGGFTIAGDELRDAYATGRGKITMRGKIQIEMLDNDKKNIVITELPYQVNKSELLKRILEVKDEKKDIFAGISQIEDESDQQGMRAVIRVKRDSDPYQIVNALCKYTDLQKTFGINMVAIADGRPQQMGLLDIISYYTDYQRKVVLSRTKFELQEATERAHILLGLVIAVKNIDEVIAIIKKSGSSADAKQSLRQRFDLSDRQAQAILDLQLRRLTKLEIDKLVAELKELEERIKQLSAIIGSKRLLMELIKNELSQIKKAYKSARRTELIGSASEAEIEVLSDEKPREEFAVGVTANGLLKRMALKHVALSSRAFSEKSTPNDTYKMLFKSCTGVMLHIFTNLGNCFKLDAFDLPDSRWRERGLSLKELFPEAAEGERPLLIEPVIDDGYPANDLYFFTASGMVKRSNWSEYKLLKNAFQAVKLKEGDEAVAVESDIKKATILLLSERGMGLHFDKSDIPLQGRISAGVKGMQLADDDKIVFAGQVNSKSDIVAVSERGYFKLLPMAEFSLLGRYRKGLKAFDLKGETGKAIVFCSASEKPRQIAMFTAGEPLLIDTRDIQPATRAHKAAALKGKKKGVDAILCCALRTDIEEET